MTRHLTLAGWTVDLARRRIERAGEVRSLSTREAELLGYLAGRPGAVVSRRELLVEVWGYAEGTRTRTLDVTVARLRAKLDDLPPRVLLTERGVGCRLVMDQAPRARSLVGREDDLAESARAFADGAALVTVLGPPGIGARSVGAEAARRVGGRFLAGATREDVAPLLFSPQPLVVTAPAPLILAGEHRLFLGSLEPAAAAALLDARLDDAGLVRPASIAGRFERIADAVEGHPGLLVAVADRLVRGGQVGLPAALDSLDPLRLARDAARDPAGPCGDLGALVAGLPPDAVSLLEAAARAPLTWEHAERLVGPRAAETVAWLMERSGLVRADSGYVVPLPLRLRIASTAAAPIQS
jgi:DNA-binding winged helix-turn-helix (wHTH) protein